MNPNAKVGWYRSVVVWPLIAVALIVVTCWILGLFRGHRGGASVVSNDKVVLAIVERDLPLLDKYLSQSPAARDTPNAIGDTPLISAVRYINIDAVRLLIARGASLEAHESTIGYTALHFAADADDRYIDIVRALLSAGADVHAADKYGHTPLHVASLRGNWLCVKLLLEEGHAQVDAATHIGVTPLRYAVTGGHIEIARFLVEHGADPTLKAQDGKSPLQLARDRQNTAMVDALLKKNPS